VLLFERHWRPSIKLRASLTKWWHDGIWITVTFVRSHRRILYIVFIGLLTASVVLVSMARRLGVECDIDGYTGGSGGQLPQPTKNLLWRHVHFSIIMDVTFAIRPFIQQSLHPPGRAGRQAGAGSFVRRTRFSSAQWCDKPLAGLILRSRVSNAFFDDSISSFASKSARKMRAKRTVAASERARPKIGNDEDGSGKDATRGNYSKGAERLILLKIRVDDRHADNGERFTAHQLVYDLHAVQSVDIHCRWL